MIKLALVIEKEETLRLKKVKEIYKKWGFKKSQVRTVHEWKTGLASSGMLFEQVMVYLHLETIANAQYLSHFVKLIDNRKKNDIFKENWFGNGVIISVPSLQGSAKIKKLVQEFGGEIHESGEQAKDDLANLNKLKLPLHLKQEAVMYAGDDPNRIAILLNGLKTLSDSELSKLTSEDFQVYLPPIPGKVPPWNFVSNLFAKNISATLSDLDRYMSNDESVIIIPMTMLKRKVCQLYEYISLKQTTKLSDTDIAKTLGLKNAWALKDFRAYSQLPLKKAETIVKLTLQEEEKVKGGHFRSDELVSFKLLLSKIHVLLGGR